MITNLGLLIQEKGTQLVQPGGHLFWFGRPRFMLFLIHLVLFTAFQLAFFAWSTYGLLKLPPILTTYSKLIKNIIKKNETRRLKSYIESGCINIHDAAQTTRACFSKWIRVCITTQSI